MTENKQKLIKYINETPTLLSLLYDLDLMPEQTADNTLDLNKMLIIAKSWNLREINFHDALTLEINRNYDKAMKSYLIERKKSVTHVNSHSEPDRVLKAIEDLKSE